MTSTKRINEATTESLPYFPILEVGKTRRVITKHFCNLALWINEDELGIIHFLVYQSLADNTFKYSTHLLMQYREAYFAARIQYSCADRRPTIGMLRFNLEQLIKKGLVLQTGKKGKLMINPLLTYSADVINNKKYKEIQELYQIAQKESVSLLSFTNYYTRLVSEFLESKKKNYKYNKRK